MSKNEPLSTDADAPRDAEPIGPREIVLYKHSPSLFRSNPIGFSLAVLLCLVVVGIVILLVWWIRSRGTVLTVTNERTILRTGILSKSLNEVWHRDVRNVVLEQKPMQRLFDVGRIAVSSAGQDDVEISVDGIPFPGEVKRIIDESKLRAIQAAERGAPA
jgi:uncharacterized membrane protein YdbT with pleckstrin-like domain